MSELETTKQKLLSRLGALAVVLTLFVGAMLIGELKSFKYIGEDVRPKDRISVSATGEAFAIPDIAQFGVTVSKEGKTVDLAQSEVTKRSNEIIAYLKGEGIEDKDIKTTSYNIHPRYEYNRRPQITCYGPTCPPVKNTRELVGYEVTMSVQVKVRNVESAGGILSGVGALGATNVSGLTFSVDDIEKVQREARKDAIAKAKEKAQMLAGDVGVSLGDIVSFSESNYSPYGGKVLMMAMDESAGRGGSIAPEIPVGESKITANVTLMYEMR